MKPTWRGYKIKEKNGFLKTRWQERQNIWGKSGSMPRWHSSWWYGGRCKWKKYDNNVRIDEENEAACPDVTPPDDMEEGVGEKIDDKNVRIDEGNSDS